MRFSKLLSAGIFLMVANVTLAQAPSYTNLGRAPTKEEIHAWDISIGPDGKGLPAGQGAAKDGAPIFADTETLTTLKPVRTVGGYWPYATSVWDFIRRAMPRDQSGTLTPNEVYALTAFILFKSNIIQEGDVLDAKTLPKVQMPNRNGFVPARFADIPDEHKRGCTQGICP
jgi:hypothetical protein